MRSFAVAEVGNATIVELDAARPPLQVREVRLKVLRAGVCHSDVHLRTGHHDLGSAGSVSLAERGIGFPLVMGHEIVGEVLEVGSGVDTVEVGQVRLVYPWIGCGRCRRCAAGSDNLCPHPETIGANRPGGYAEEVVVPDERYLLDVGDLDLDVAATLACSGLTAFGAAKKLSDVLPHGPVVVIGAGGVGLSLISVLRSLGHDDVCVVDANPASLARARDCGASTVLHAGAEVAAVTVRDAIGGPAEAVVDLVNNTSTVALAFDLVAKGGTIVSVGLYGGDFVVPAVMVPLKAVRVLGSYVGTLEELRELVALTRAGVVRPVPVESRRLDRAGVSDALDALERGQVVGRRVLRPGP